MAAGTTLIDKAKIRRILVLKWSAMGDIVVSTAFFEDIRRAFPDATIDLNVGKAFAGLFTADPRFREVICSDFKGSDRRLPGLLAWVKRTRKAGYDLIFDLQSNDRSRLLLTLLRVSSVSSPMIVGLHDRFPYHVAPPPDTPAGSIRQERALAAAGVEHVTARPVLAIPEVNRKKVAELLATHNLETGKYGIFFPGCQAGGELKRWGWQRYAALAERLYRADNTRVVLVGGPDDLQECDNIMAAVSDTNVVVNLCGQTAILDVLPLVESSHFVVGNDTGTVHIASCTTKPIIVICGPTDPRRVKPVGDNVVALQADIDCINCYRKECNHHSCMEQVTVEMVLEKLNTLMGKTNAC